MDRTFEIFLMGADGTKRTDLSISREDKHTFRVYENGGWRMSSIRPID